MITFIQHHPEATLEVFGGIPFMLSEHDQRPVREQLDNGYRHGGGWSAMHGHTMQGDTLFFPGDPPFEPLAELRVRDERIVIYDYSIVAIVQPDGSFEVARMD